MPVTTENVNNVLEEVREFLRRDGGDLELVDISDDNVVTVKLQGHCVGCPGARMTLKGVVERVLQANIPDVKSVEALDFDIQ